MVRDVASAALQAIMQSWGAETAVAKLDFSWIHRNARVRQSVLQAMTAAIAAMPVALSMPGSWPELVLQPTAGLLEDPIR